MSEQDRECSQRHKQESTQTESWRERLRAGEAIAVAADHGGWALFQPLVALLEGGGYQVLSFSPPLKEGVASRCDYPLQVEPALDALSTGQACCALLICGSGVGVSIAANRRRGIRAVLAHDPYIAKLSRAHNDANVLCLGARLCGPAMAEETLSAFLSGTFDGGRHQQRVALLDRPEKQGEV
ncbi:MAG: RpiB/LacA/LacB family sugar-phosphate isomerase [Myxococcota bacterium]|nr:RpiB/LacA/LacB family sugar-phosphate isomerase [Myxococcota bacterium]